MALRLLIIQRAVIRRTVLYRITAVLRRFIIIELSYVELVPGENRTILPSTDGDGKCPRKKNKNNIIEYNSGGVEDWKQLLIVTIN